MSASPSAVEKNNQDGFLYPLKPQSPSPYCKHGMLMPAGNSAEMYAFVILQSDSGRVRALPHVFQFPSL
jgi:hypothetical protein